MLTHYDAEWCWNWNASTLATSCEELTHWKRLPLMLGGIGGRRRKGQQRIRWLHHRLSGHGFGWTWVWWWTGRPGMLQFMRFFHEERIGHDWATELNWIRWIKVKALVAQSFLTFCNLMNCSPPDSSVHGIFMEFLCKYGILGIMEFIEFYGILMELWHFFTF